MKYVGEDGRVKMLIAERHPFKEVENYFTDSLQDSLETDENPRPEKPDSGNEADMEPEEHEYLWEINTLVMSIDKLDVDITDNVEGERFINEDLDFAYFSAFTSDSVPSDTNTYVDSDT